MIMGLPGAGKTTLASTLVAEGFARLNRDEAGGTLAALTPRLAAMLQAGEDRIVLDNTYLSRASRAGVIDLAAQHGRRIRGVWLDTSIEDAQVNVVWRMLDAHGRLLTDEELKAGGAPERLSPSALFRAQRDVERPDADEGFSQLDIVPFARQHHSEHTNRAVIFWCDSVLRPPWAARRNGAELDAAALTLRRDRLAEYAAQGWRLFGLSWEPRIAEQLASVADVEREFDLLRESLGAPLEFHYCPHGAGPPVCWCRKPLPGLGVLLLRQHQLDPAQCVYVGASPQDPPFARRLGFQYRDAAEFFK
jgi:predicted kinase